MPHSATDHATPHEGQRCASLRILDANGSGVQGMVSRGELYVVVDRDRAARFFAESRTRRPLPGPLARTLAIDPLLHALELGVLAAWLWATATPGVVLPAGAQGSAGFLEAWIIGLYLLVLVIQRPGRHERLAGALATFGENVTAAPGTVTLWISGAFASLALLVVAAHATHGPGALWMLGGALLFLVQGVRYFLPVAAARVSALASPDAMREMVEGDVLWLEPAAS